jgi:predicted homoserine dehydrogenase-like protein
MTAVDTALEARAAAGRPIQVAIVGAGVNARSVALQLLTPPPGIRLAAICNRTLDHAARAFAEGGVPGVRTLSSASALDQAIGQGAFAITDDPAVVCESGRIDLVLEATGTVDHAAGVLSQAIAGGKHVTLLNAELDSLLGPLFSARARAAGVTYTHGDGEEPGVAMTLLRYLRSTGLRPVAAGNVKGMVDYYRTPETQRGFAEKYGQNPMKVTSFADATKLSMETTILANATGFRAGRRGMYGPSCAHVNEMAALLPPDEMLAGGLVDYSLGAAPHTGAWVVVHEPHPAKRAHLTYYKLGDGPFYVFYTPFHLPHIQVGSTIGRAVVLGDPTVAPADGPVCEVVTVAKRDLAAGEMLDGVGGFCTYGLIDNTAAARAGDALPMGLSEDCRLLRAVRKDEVLRFADVTRPAGRLCDQLWDEQAARWPQATTAAGRSST